MWKWDDDSNDLQRRSSLILNRSYHSYKVQKRCCIFTEVIFYIFKCNNGVVLYNRKKRSFGLKKNSVVFPYFLGMLVFINSSEIMSQRKMCLMVYEYDSNVYMSGQSVRTKIW